MLILALFFSLTARAEPLEPVRFVTAEFSLVRSFVTWPNLHGRIGSEVACKGKFAVPVYDFRSDPRKRLQAEAGKFSCETRYRDIPVPVVISGRVELVPADEFGLGLPDGAAVLRIYFLLYADVGSAFPYLDEIQNLTGFQVFHESLELGNQSFLLSPEAFISLHCSTLGCEAEGPQSVYRAQIRLTTEAGMVSADH